MASGGGVFSPEEIKYLKSLPAVAEATAKRITYTDDFKRYCVVRYSEGASPVRMFREAGLDPALIGYKRIERCIARWREAQEEILSANPDADDSILNGNNVGGGYRIPGILRRMVHGANHRSRHFHPVMTLSPISVCLPNAGPSFSRSPTKNRTTICAICSLRSKCVASMNWSVRWTCWRRCRAPNSAGGLLPLPQRVPQRLVQLRRAARLA